MSPSRSPDRLGSNRPRPDQLKAASCRIAGRLRLTPLIEVEPSEPLADPHLNPPGAAVREPIVNWTPPENQRAR